eukprot:906691-Pyramimonas_sp.AAC.1
MRRSAPKSARPQPNLKWLKSQAAAETPDRDASKHIEVTVSTAPLQVERWSPHLCAMLEHLERFDEALLVGGGTHLGQLKGGEDACSLHRGGGCA